MNKINQLLDKEHNLLLNLQQCKQHSSRYFWQLENVKKGFTTGSGTLKEISHFQQILSYYQRDLVPALEEIIELGRKHAEVARKNPDKSFKPIRLELKDQYKLIRQFLNRFKNVETEIKSVLNKLNTSAD